MEATRLKHNVLQIRAWREEIGQLKEQIKGLKASIAELNGTNETMILNANQAELPLEAISE